MSSVSRFNGTVRTGILASLKTSVGRAPGKCCNGVVPSKEQTAVLSKHHGRAELLDDEL